MSMPFLLLAIYLFKVSCSTSEVHIENLLSGFQCDEKTGRKYEISQSGDILKTRESQIHSQIEKIISKNIHDVEFESFGYIQTLYCAKQVCYNFKSFSCIKLDVSLDGISLPQTYCELHGILRTRPFLCMFKGFGTKMPKYKFKSAGTIKFSKYVIKDVDKESTHYSFEICGHLYIYD